MSDKVMPEKELTPHTWQPSVISVRHSDGVNTYTGNILIGLNMTKTEVINLVKDYGVGLIQGVTEFGDEWIGLLNQHLTPFTTVNGILGNTVADLRAEFQDLFGDPLIEDTVFYLDISRLDETVLG